MAYEIPTGVPTEVTVGDLIKWKIPEYSDFPIADLWVLSYALVNTGNHETITTTDNGDNHHLATVEVATSTNWIPGNYKWQSYITKGTERYQLSEGTIEVKPNFATQTTGYDGRTFWKTVLDNVEAVLEQRATKDQSSYTINGRQLSRTPMTDLIELYDKAKKIVSSEDRTERINKGLGHSGNIKLSFR